MAAYDISMGIQFRFCSIRGNSMEWRSRAFNMARDNRTIDTHLLIVLIDLSDDVFSY